MSKSSTDISHPYDVLGSGPDDQVLTSYLDDLYSASKQNSPLLTSSERTPVVKMYSDKTVYHSYRALGLDLEFRPMIGFEGDERLQLVGIDIENHVRNEDEILNSDGNRPIQSAKNRSKTVKTPPLPFCGYPIFIEPRSMTSGISRSDSGSRTLHLRPETTGRDFLESLGEPTRKGGQDVLRSDSGIWLEWTWNAIRLDSKSCPARGKAEKEVKYGLFVQWRGAASVGPEKWEKGKDRKWSTLKIFLDL